jgi:hypothetical protein
VRCAAVVSKEAAPNSNHLKASPCEQEHAQLRGEAGSMGSADLPGIHPNTSYSTYLDNLVDVMYGRHSQQAQALPSCSKGSHGSVSWSPAQSLSFCTDDGVSGDYFSRTPCSHTKRLYSDQRHGMTGGYRKCFAVDDCTASRMQAPGTAGWQPLSGSPAPSCCAQTADSSSMMSPLGVCMLQSACMPDKHYTVMVTTSQRFGYCQSTHLW